MEDDATTMQDGAAPVTEETSHEEETHTEAPAEETSHEGSEAASEEAAM